MRNSFLQGSEKFRFYFCFKFPILLPLKTFSNWVVSLNFTQFSFWSISSINEFILLIFLTNFLLLQIFSSTLLYFLHSICEFWIHDSNYFLVNVSLLFVQSYCLQYINSFIKLLVLYIIIAYIITSI